MITIDELIKRDLYKEIRTYTDHDDSDWPTTFEPPVEVSDANINELDHFFHMHKSDFRTILEIGLASEVKKSFTKFFIDNKVESTKYFGVDKEDRTYLNDSSKNIYTIKTDSTNFLEVKTFLNAHGVEKLDFIFIDGYPSINQILDDWRYVELLDDNGFVAFHDTNFHPGPVELVNNLNLEKYGVYKNCVANNDWGLTFISKKNRSKIDQIVSRDLTEEIRTFTKVDDIEWDEYCPMGIDFEISDCNRKLFIENFHSIKDKCTSILEIGVCNNDENSLSHVLINQKDDDAFYFGVDLKDKTFLDNHDKNVFTIQSDSADLEKIMSFVNSKGVKHFDFIFIDGWHSVNHVLKEWRFVEYLSDFGIVAIHDTNYHPGPRKFIKVLNPERYIIDKTCTEGKDWGISFIKKR